MYIPRIHEYTGISKVGPQDVGEMSFHCCTGRIMPEDELGCLRWCEAAPCFNEIDEGDCWVGMWVTFEVIDAWYEGVDIALPVR